MRVGILLNNHPPEIGGGFTFEHEVFDTLLRLAPETSHQFVVLHPATQPGDRSPANVEFPLAVAKPIRRVVSASRRLWLERTSRAFDIDLLWSIVPLHPVTDTPYLTISFDLQHRLQPLFPEVSANGEWEAREGQHKVRLRRAARIITGTEVGKAEIMNFYQVPAERITVLPHPTPRFALEAPADRDEAVLDKYRLPRNYLFYPAQFWAHKNHANLLLALEVLQKRDGLILPLVLVGSDRGNSQYVQQMIRELGLSSKVFSIGFVPVTDLVALYRNAFALTYMSLFGPDNLPPLEAFALGCPVIASKVSGAAEQLGDAALLVDATRPEAIATAIKSLHDDAALRARLIASGHDRARRFTGDHYVRGIFGVIDELAPLIRCWRPSR